MFRLFSFGIVLGLGLAGAAAWFLPVTDLHREVSIISVQPNGGNAELFRIHLPDDRIVAGGTRTGGLTPDSLTWPNLGPGADVDVELFKVRNRDDVVIGVASRIAGGDAGALRVSEWALHLPARGSMYFPMSPTIDADGSRRGDLRAGTREFLQRAGSLRERVVGAGSAGDGGATIELSSTLVATVGRSGERLP